MLTEVLVSSSFLITILIFLKVRKDEKKGKKTRKRRMSFTSANMAMGCMPEKAKLSDPIINILITFENPPKEDDLIPLVETLFEYDRLSQVPKCRPGFTDWRLESVGDIDPKRMIRSVNVVCETKEEWAEVIQQQHVERSSIRKEDLPWWEFLLLINDRDNDNVLLCRFDHSITDGLSIGKVFTRIMKRMDGSEISTLVPKSMVSNKTKSDEKRLEMLLKLPKAILDVSTSPLGKYDDGTHFSKNLVGKDVVDRGLLDLLIFDPVPIDFIKEMKNKAGVSLNDILLTVWSHAILDFCEHHECPVIKNMGERLQCRALMTYGFPNISLDKAEAVKNGWVPLSLNLNVGIRDILKKLKCINTQTTKLKNSPLARVQLYLQNAILPYVPVALNRKTVYGVYSRHSMICTNVPGPQERVCIAHQPVKSCMFFVPFIHPVLSMLSYNGQIHITFTANKSAIQNVELLPKFYMKALLTLGNKLDVDIPPAIAKLVNGGE